MNIVAIIPARSGSKSVYKKNIASFNESPLISYTIKQARATKFNIPVYVTSDCQEILSIAETYGAIPILRPDNISGDYSTSESALIHAIEKIEKETQRNVDICVFLQATSPLREVSDIENAISKLLIENLDSVFSASVLEDFLIWKNENEVLQSVNYDYKNRKRRQDSEKQYVENGSIYVTKRDLLIKNANRLCGKIGASLMDSWKSYEIDSYEDLEICEMIYKSKLCKK